MPTPDQDRFLIKLDRFWQDYGTNTLDIVSVIICALCTLSFNNNAISILTTTVSDQKNIQFWAFYVLLPFLFLQIVAKFSLLKKQGLISKIQHENKELKDSLANNVQLISSLGKGYLVDLAERLEFGKDGSCCERVTLYRHDTNRRFYNLERYSKNPEYIQLGRNPIPDDKGCIAKAWRQGHYFCNEFSDPEQNLKSYQHDSTKEGISKSVANNLAMKSRLYFGWRVLDRKKESPLAVIIIESTDPNRYEEIFLRELFKGEQGRYLSDLLEVMKPQIPDSSVAKEKGM